MVYGRALLHSGRALLQSGRALYMVTLSTRQARVYRVQGRVFLRVGLPCHTGFYTKRHFHTTCLRLADYRVPCIKWNTLRYRVTLGTVHLRGNDRYRETLFARCTRGNGRYGKDDRLRRHWVDNRLRGYYRVGLRVCH